MILTEDADELATSLAAWLNSLQTHKCSAFALNHANLEEMYGSKESPGLYEKFLKKASQEKDTEHYLIITGKSTNEQFGHEFNPISFEQLNTVMDDNKTLIVAEDHKVPVPPNARLVFVAHPEGPKLLSPASVSRMGFVMY